MIYGITLILLSIIAVPSLVLSRKPSAAVLLEKVEPYQGWIGLVCCFFGIWGFLQAVFNLDWLSFVPVWWITLLAGSVVQAGLGFMLGYPLINRFFLSNNASAREKAEHLRGRIAPQQGRLGVIGIVVGAWMILASVMFAVV